MLPAVVATLALVAVTVVLFEQQTRRAQKLVDLRSSLMAGQHDHTRVVDEDLRLRSHGLYPELEGLSYADHPAVQKMWERVRTGGGFYPMTFRDTSSGRLRSFLYLCGSDGNGAMRCAGSAMGAAR